MRRQLRADPAQLATDAAQQIRLANQRLAEGDLVAAERLCVELLARIPEQPFALAILGSAALGHGRFEQAVDYLSRALAMAPDQPVLLVNLGEACRRAGRQEDSIGHLRRAVLVGPEFAAAHYNLALALFDSGAFAAAGDAIREALRLQPDIDTAGIFGRIQLRAARASVENGELDDAVLGFEQAIHSSPDARSRCDALRYLATLYFNLGRLDEALVTCRQAIETCPEHYSPGSDLLFFTQFHPNIDAQANWREVIDWRRRYVEPLGIEPAAHENVVLPERKLRVGYVSADFTHHVSTCFTRPLLANHDRAGFEVFCYSDVKAPDAWTAILRGYSDRWRDITGLSDAAVAEVVQQDKVDILVDLSLHIADSRPLIFAYKSAPIQLCWLGYPGTSGQNTIDYRVSDPYLDPEGCDESVYTERTLRLPDCFWCYDPLLTGLEVSPSPLVRAGFPTFGALNSFAKVNSEVLRLWARILRNVKDSRLILLVPPGKSRRWVAECFAREGVDVSRVEFVYRVPRREYFDIYGRIDIGLDPFPYNGHTTSLDAYFMGVPVVTLKGATAVGRAGTSIAMNLGMPELVANTEDEYVNIARSMARNPQRLSDIRAGLRDRMLGSPLMDAPQFARNFEALYRDVWRRYCRDRCAIDRDISDAIMTSA